MTEDAAPAPSAAVPRDSFASTVALCAALGLIVGVSFPSFHVAIEPAQVLAGLVDYPPENPFGIYERRLWTIWHQLLAVPLALGVPESTLSFAVSGLVGALSFAAVGSIAAALGASRLLALLATLVLWIENPDHWGFNYPILLVGHPHTYGMAGLSWIVLAWGLLGAKRFGWGGFGIGSAPALHPALGAWAALITGLCVLADWRRLRPELRRFVLGGALGAALAAVSLALHWVMQEPVPPVDPAELRRAFDAFLLSWDSHRAAYWLLPWQKAAIVAGGALFLSLLARGAGGAGTRLMLRAILGCTAVGLGFVALGDRARDFLPDALLATMPTRLGNALMIALVPATIGAFAQRWEHPVARVSCYALGYLARFSHAIDDSHWLVLAAIVPAVVLLWWRPRAEPAAAPAPAIWDRVLAIGLALGLASAVFSSIRLLPVRAARLHDLRSDPVLAEAARGEGLLVVGPPLETIQLRTRRPVLTDPNAIDMIAYVPQGAPLLARIITDVYGEDFFAVPPGSRNAAVIDRRLTRRAWKSRSEREWRALAERYGFRDVLVPPNWELALPLVTRSEFYALYRVGPSGSQ